MRDTVEWRRITLGAPAEVLEEADVRQLHVRDHAPAPRELNPSIPPTFEAIILKSMAKNPEHRSPPDPCPAADRAAPERSAGRVSEFPQAISSKIFGR